MSNTKPNRVVIVESPTKARTISRFLDDSYTVESSFGHIRDLPRSSAEVPKAYKSEPWARLGIDIENDFKPLYVVSREGAKRVRELRQIVREADELYLATDEDREGEAIAWHLLEELSPPSRIRVHRMVFHEITREAIARALENLRDIDRRLVDAQEARRLLDRLYGFEVSPVLWKKVASGLSAGRVQSVATRIVVGRERERIEFVSAPFWSLTMKASLQDGASFTSRLSSLNGQVVAQSRNFGSDGKVNAEKVFVLTALEAERLGKDLDGKEGKVSSVSQKPYRRRPNPPFITSTLQQEGERRLGLSSKQVMQLAQSLYEQGFITYMRTDSTALSGTAIATVRAEVGKRFGEEYLPPKPRQYRAKSRNAQEAHEAIRPAGEKLRHPSEVIGALKRQEARLYDLIWRRTMASQMTDATGKTVRVALAAQSSQGEAVFSASGTVISHAGFRKALTPYAKAADNGEEVRKEALSDQVLPAVAEGASVQISEPEPAGHETKPPARFTEASLIRRLEEMGVGRPSTYASIMGTIQDRGYVWKKGSALVPAFTAFIVVGLMEQHFADLVDYTFTARMEDDLDQIANGSNESVPWLRMFYFGDGAQGGLKAMVTDNVSDIDARAINSVPVGELPDGSPVEVRHGRYGTFIMCGDKRADLPENLPPDELTVDRALQLLETRAEARELGADPVSGLPVTARTGRYGPFVQLGPSPDDDGSKPRYASLFKSMSPETVTLEEALKLLSLPRHLEDDSDGEVIVVQNGRYGPFIKKGKETRSLDFEEQLFTVTLTEARQLLSQPKRRASSTTQRQLRTLGDDPATGREITVRDGRYGPYVSDGETNASLSKGEDPETVSIQRALELLEERRASGGKPRGGRSRSGRSARPAKRRSS